MILAVTGGRDYCPDWSDYVRIDRAILKLGVTTLRHGGCRGADLAVADHVAHNFANVRVVLFAADWKKHGRAAGPRRNALMLRGADALLALPGGKGTADACQRAKDLLVPVYDLSKWDF